MKIIYFILLIMIGLVACDEHIPKENISNIIEGKTSSNHYFNNEKYEVTHVLVSLCDNKYQGIVKVPVGIGNGQDAGNNLYWGCAYGVKTYLKNQAYWTIVETQKSLNDTILERVVFQHKMVKIY